MAAPDWRYSEAYWERLVQVYMEQLRENPKSYVYVPLADALVYLGRINDAIEILTWGLTKLPDSRAAKVMLAQLLYDIGDIAGAKLILEDVAGRWPDITEAVSLLCKIYEAEGDNESAKVKSKALLNYYPESAPVRKMVQRYDGTQAAKPEARHAAMGDAGTLRAAPVEPLAEARNPAEKSQERVLTALEEMLNGFEALKQEGE